MNRSMYKPGLLVAFLPLTLGCYSTPLVWVESRETLELSSTDVHTLAAKTHNGQISVRPSPDGQSDIHVIVDKRAGGASQEDAEAAMSAIQLQTPIEDGTQHIKWSWMPLRKNGWGSRVSYTITMPARLSAQAKTHNGDIRVEDIEGGASIETHNGDIGVSNIGGRLSAKTHNGPIRIKGHRGGELRAESHNGRIHADSTAAKFRVAAHNGGVQLDVTGAPPHLEGHVQTHNAGITVKLPPKVSAKLHASTHNGRISCRHALDHMTSSRRSLDGRMGEGAGDLHIGTHNGSIAID